MGSNANLQTVVVALDTASVDVAGVADETMAASATVLAIDLCCRVSFRTANAFIVCTGRNGN